MDVDAEDSVLSEHPYVKYMMKLKIMPSQVPAVQAFNGKGLFAYDPNQPAGAEVFKKGDVILDTKGRC